MPKLHRVEGDALRLRTRFSGRLMSLKCSRFARQRGDPRNSSAAQTRCSERRSRSQGMSASSYSPTCRLSAPTPNLPSSSRPRKFTCTCAACSTWVIDSSEPISTRACGFLQRLARGRRLQRLAVLQEAGRRGPVAATRLDGALAQQNAALPFGHAADHDARILVVNGAAGGAHRARQIVAGRDAHLHRLTAGWTEFHKRLRYRTRTEGRTALRTCQCSDGLVAELVDAVDSKSTGLAHLGSTPSEATICQCHSIPSGRSNAATSITSCRRELIAQAPLPQRSASRLLLLDGAAARGSDSRMRRAAVAAARRRSAGIQRHPRGAGAPAGAQAQRRPHRAVPGARAATARGRWCSCATASRCGRAWRCRPRGGEVRLIARRGAVLGSRAAGRGAGVLRAPRAGAAAALHRARRRGAPTGERYQSLLGARAGRGRGADRQPAFRSGAARGAGGAGHRARVTHAARRGGHVPAAAQRDRWKRTHAQRAL